MLRFFFDRFSKVVMLMEILGVIFSALWLSAVWQNPPPLLPKILLAAYVGEYLVLRFCAVWRWHPEARRYEGLELHFKKIMIPASYILAIFSLVGWLANIFFHLWLADAALGIMIYVNLTLLYLHFKDKNETPINYFSGNKFDNAATKG